ncbi:hypothetical protein Tco_0578906, partial [Tanacetum coccineum]
MDYLHITEAELGINLDIPLSKQDLLDKLNDLANKKRKHADNIHDYFKANKRLKAAVYKVGKRLFYVKRNKVISLGKGASKVGIEVQQLSLKDYT